ncbi:hypothetical protein [Thalassomonas actiniarum]|uniref:Uncharacterized protein n=1 Tax=Thalassomonas actiniarum TaxID=485447 RepID=A0AAE9YM64_9GAMM|nr:hypothetical protein [Thalassomonas actiniarum]WDD97879.1 hypothetical protein SG35_021685 [Thalassomonas actiniarum]
MNTSKNNPAPSSFSEEQSSKKDAAKVQTECDIKNVEQKAISAEVLALANDFHTFSSDCAFLCEAFAAIASEQPRIDGYTVYGFNRYSLWIKEQVVDFDERIQKLQEHIREQH